MMVHPCNPSLRQRPEDQQELRIIFNYIISQPGLHERPAWATWDPILKYKTKLEWKEGREELVRTFSFFISFAVLCCFHCGHCLLGLQFFRFKSRCGEWDGCGGYSYNPSSWELEAEGSELEVIFSHMVSSRPDSTQKRRRRSCLTHSSEHLGQEPSNNLGKAAQVFQEGWGKGF